MPFQGGAPAMNAAVAGHIDLLAATVGGGVAAQIKAGKLKGIAMASEKRIAVTPDVPTFAEGGFAGVTAASWVGFFVPAKTPPDVVAKLHGAIDAIVKEADMRQRLATLGFDPVTGTQAEAQATVQVGSREVGKDGHHPRPDHELSGTIGDPKHRLTRHSGRQNDGETIGES